MKRQDVNMTKLRAIVREGPDVVKDAVKFVTAKGKAKVNEVLTNPFRTTAIVTPVQSRKRLEFSLERFRYEWGRRKPEPDEFRKDLEKGYEFHR